MLIILCLVLIIIILIIVRRKEHFDLNKPKEYTLDKSIENMNFNISNSSAILLKETSELRKCLQNSCREVYNEAHKLINKTMYVLLDSYYPRMMFLFKMLTHNADFCSQKVSKLEDFGFNMKTITKIKDALHNKKDITPFMINVMSLINLELKSFVADFKIKFKKLENNNIIKEYVNCLCNHCEKVDLSIERIFEKISVIGNRLKDELKNITVLHNMNNKMMDVIDNLFLNWLDLFEFMRYVVKENVGKCDNSIGNRAASYCKGPLFPKKDVKILDNKMIYEPSNFIFSTVNNDDSIKKDYFKRLDFKASVNGNNVAYL